MQGLDRCFAQGGLYRVVIVYLFFVYEIGFGYFVATRSCL